MRFCSGFQKVHNPLQSIPLRPVISEGTSPAKVKGKPGVDVFSLCHCFSSLCVVNGTLNDRLFQIAIDSVVGVVPTG